MTENTEKIEQLGGSLDALRVELDELQRRVAVSDEKIDLFPIEAAANKRKWYREPSVLVAALALVVSVGTFVVGQLNVISDREIQDRNRLSALIEQLPSAFAQVQANSVASTDLVLLVSGSAAALIDKLDPEASTVYEKVEVAIGLVGGADLPSARRLATAAAQQSTNVREKSLADCLIANIDFQIGDVAGGRDVYRKIITQIQNPQNEPDPPVVRDRLTANVELLWANDEFVFAKSCQGATEQLENAEQLLNRISPDQVTAQTANRSNLAKTVATGCPAAVR
ncbi:MAG: hypothetical protein ACRDTX_18340 [Pseudonocardiaceae bacterium]